MNNPLPQRRSLRLLDHDYSQAGAYFVTICTQERMCIFGQVVDGSMRLNALGEIVWSCWEDMPDHRPEVELDAFVVMPNHMHGIAVIADRRDGVGDGSQTGETSLAPTVRREGDRRATLGAIVGAFKAAVTRATNELPGKTRQPLWQRGYYEHVIRSEVALSRIREYIEQNPAKWALDHDNPANWR